MKLHDFIFSKNRKYRWARHLSFWLCWILFSACVQLTGFIPANTTLENIIPFQLTRAVNRLLPNILFCYLTVYYLVPRFIPKRKYTYFAFSLILLFFLLYWFTYFYTSPLLAWHSHHFGYQAAISPFTKKFFSFYTNINFTGLIPATCLMLAIKYYKDWYIKQKESEMLVRENKQAELQLLKAQVHPHFLFNTLNNIYSFTLTEHPEAANLVDKLSGMIDYMSIEGAKPVVPVEKEIQLIKDYIGLEKVRYGNRLNIEVGIKGSSENKLITPLLMIPFVENSFKHGASKILKRPWIKLHIEIKPGILSFLLINSKPNETITANGKNGIGLKNVQKRLNLLYSKQYQLKIDSTDDQFSVQMEIPLLNDPAANKANELLKESANAGIFLYQQE